MVSETHMKRKRNIRQQISRTRILKALRSSYSARKYVMDDAYELIEFLRDRLSVHIGANMVHRIDRTLKDLQRASDEARGRP